MMGGFHVSGYPESVKFLNSCGITTIVGEAENLLGRYHRGFSARRAEDPDYSVTEGIRAKTGQEDIIVPLITEAQLPVIDDRYLTRFFNDTMTTLDTSRGCPFTCSYCSVKNVMGRTMRSREPDAVVSWVRDACQHHGIESLFLVDDDFFRIPRWEEILTGLVEVKKEYPQLSFMMQVDVDASCYANVAEGETETAKHRRSKRFTRTGGGRGMLPGVRRNRVAQPRQTQLRDQVSEHRRPPATASSRQSRARVFDKYRRVVDNWHKVGVSVHAGYMLGFPFDGPDCGRIAAKTLKKIGFDIVSFFIMTPLPGTEDQVRFTKEGAIIDWDFNSLDSQHVTLKHDKLDKETWLGAYRDAYTGFYSFASLLHTMFTVCGRPRTGCGSAQVDAPPVHVLFLQLSPGTASDGRRGMADSPA